MPKSCSDNILTKNIIDSVLTDWDNRRKKTVYLAADKLLEVISDFLLIFEVLMAKYYPFLGKTNGLPGHVDECKLG